MRCASSARSYAKQGRYAEALQAFEEALRIRRAKLGRPAPPRRRRSPASPRPPAPLESPRQNASDLLRISNLSRDPTETASQRIDRRRSHSPISIPILIRFRFDVRRKKAREKSVRCECSMNERAAYLWTSLHPKPMPCHAIPRHTATLCNSCLKSIFSLLVEHVHHSVPLCRVPRGARRSVPSPRHTAHDTSTHHIGFWQCCVDIIHTTTH